MEIMEGNYKKNIKKDLNEKSRRLERTETFESRSSVCMPGIDSPANILDRDEGMEPELDPELFCLLGTLLQDKPKRIDRRWYEMR